MQKKKAKVKESHYRPRQALRVPGGWGRFQYNRHMKVVRLSALSTGRLYPPRPRRYSLSRPQGHSATRRIMSKKNYNDTIGNRTRDLPACSAVPHIHNAFSINTNHLKGNKICWPNGYIRTQTNHLFLQSIHCLGFMLQRFRKPVLLTAAGNRRGPIWRICRN